MFCVIVQEYTNNSSHYLHSENRESNNKELNTLDLWLKENKVIGISNIDIRYLTKIIREQGVCRARIYPTNFDKLIPFININDENLVSKVSCNELIEYKSNNTLN